MQESRSGSFRKYQPMTRRLEASHRPSKPQIQREVRRGMTSGEIGEASKRIPSVKSEIRY